MYQYFNHQLKNDKFTAYMQQISAKNINSRYAPFFDAQRIPRIKNIGNIVKFKRKRMTIELKGTIFTFNGT